MRKPLIAANWKMHKTNDEAVKFVDELKLLIKDVEGVQVLICPPFTAIANVGMKMELGGNLWLGAQDIFYEKQGAYTGEICGEMLTTLGCCFAIVGHSERRNYFNESDNTVNRKLKACLDNDLTPILCVGEPEEVRDAGDEESFVGSQLKGCLDGVDDINKVIIAYEPVWAIGTGKTAEPSQAQSMHAFIRSKLSDMFGDASQVRILYGGSVKPDNVKELMAQEDIDGGLVGGASLKADSFEKIIRF